MRQGTLPTAAVSSVIVEDTAAVRAFSTERPDGGVVGICTRRFFTAKAELWSVSDLPAFAVRLGLNEARARDP